MTRIGGRGPREGAMRRRQKAEKEALKRNPDATEQAIIEANRLMRQTIRDANGGEGLVVGPLTVAAEHAATQLVEAHGLTEQERPLAVAFLVGCMGEVIHAFPSPPVLPSFGEWRHRSEIVGDLYRESVMLSAERPLQ